MLYLELQSVDVKNQVGNDQMSQNKGVFNDKICLSESTL